MKIYGISRFAKLLASLLLILLLSNHNLVAQQATVYESIVTVKFNENVSSPTVQQLAAALNLTELRRSRSNFIDYQIPANTDPVAVAYLLQSYSEVYAVQLNTVGQLMGDPDDDRSESVGSWYIDKLRLEEVWDKVTGDESVIVAVIDSGIDFNHEDIGLGTDSYQNLYFNPDEDVWADPNNPATGNQDDEDGNGKKNDWRGWNFVDANNDISDNLGHGTSMSGLIAAKTHNNTIGMAGVAGGFDSPGVRILPILWTDGVSTGNSSNLHHAIDYAVDQGAKIISMSLSVPESDPNFPQYPAVSAAITRAVDAGVILVAAAGNPDSGDLGEQEMSFPASHPSVISIGGITEDEDPYGDYGSDPNTTGNVFLLDFVAPAKQVVSLKPNDQYELGTGTSQATAITAGVIALMVSIDGCTNRDDVFAALKNSAIKINESINQNGTNNYQVYSGSPGRSVEHGFGLINPFQAISDFEDRVITSPIVQDMVITSFKKLNTDLIINTGATLTVSSNGSLNIAPDRRIIIERGAKLVIDGGTITNSVTCSDDKWEGIYVLGNKNLPQPADPAAPLTANESGVLWVKTGGTIENARNAVYTKHPDQPWVSDYWGGLVVAEVAFFVNNRRAVEFMQYTANNNSRFVDTEFTFTDPEANLAAVTIWDTDNILFDNCTFTGYDTGVIAYDAGCSVLNSTLRDCDFGLEIFATSPVSSGAPMTINNNLFENIFLDGINSHASDMPKLLRILANDFDQVGTGVYLEGGHDFLILDNKIENDFAGIHLWDSGLGISEINCNTLEQLDMSITAEGDCSGVQVLDNGFISIYSDLALFDVNGQAGKLFESQGQEDMPANNCFSPGGALHLASFGNTVPYTYYVPDDVPMTDCRIPSNTGGNNIQLTSRLLLIECDRPLVGPGDDKTAYLNLFNQYQIATGGGTPPQGQTWTSISIYDMRRQLRVGLQQWLRDGLLNGTSSDLEDVVIATDPDEGLKQLYGLHLQRGEWTQAQQYLTQIRSDVKNTTFAEVQDVNLARLQMTTATFEPTPAQWTTLEQAALTNSSAGNYAKGLLSLLRGDSFPSDLTLPGPQAFQATPPSITEGATAEVSLFPNPTTGRLFVRFPYAETGTLRLFDQVGRTVLQQEIANTARLELDLSNIVEGIYFFELITTTLSTPLTRSIIINR